MAEWKFIYLLKRSNVKLVESSFKSDNLCKFTVWCPDVLADKSHPRFDRRISSIKVRLIRRCLRYMIVLFCLSTCTTKWVLIFEITSNCIKMVMFEKWSHNNYYYEITFQILPFLYSLMWSQKLKLIKLCFWQDFSYYKLWTLDFVMQMFKMKPSISSL